MIRKLRQRFIRIALIALTIAMVLVVAVVNAANWFSVRGELQQTLTFLSENESMATRDAIFGRMPGKNRHVRNLISESNWFSVICDPEGTIRNINLLNTLSTDEETARTMADQVLSGNQTTGFLSDHLYTVQEGPMGGTVVLFLNCETKLAAVRTLGLISALACLGGILLAFLLVSLASRRAIQPIIRNMEQQKQFITNASHELKTPLTVISTNMELMQMEQPDNPWVKSTQKQTAQMRHLVDELVYLSRMEEENAPLTMENLPFGQLLLEAAEPFTAMAEYQGKVLTAKAEENLYVKGDRASIQRLLSTLLDNAVKYAAPEGDILVNAVSEGKQAVLTVENPVEKPLSEDQCRQLFDRFYRADPSRNKDKQSGFGIGLAIAAAIVEKHGGHLSAAMTDNNRLRFTCVLPKGGAA